MKALTLVVLLATITCGDDRKPGKTIEHARSRSRATVTPKETRETLTEEEREAFKWHLSMCLNEWCRDRLSPRGKWHDFGCDFDGEAHGSDGYRMHCTYIICSTQDRIKTEYDVTVTCDEVFPIVQQSPYRDTP